MQYKTSSNYIGIFLVISSSFCYAILNCILKKIGHNLPPLILVFYRNLFLILILLPFLIFLIAYRKNTSSTFHKNNLLLNVVRGSLGFLGICFWVMAVSKLPITECIAISFTTPLFITLLAILILKEKVSITKWGCLFIGFFGAIIVMSPDFTKLSFYSLLVLAAAMLWAASAIVIKTFVTYYHPVPVIFFTSFISLLLSVPALTQNPILPSNKQLLLLFISSILSALAQVLMGFAYKNSPITVVIPFDFTRLIFASIIAYFLFNEIISISTIIGSIMIIVSASFIVLSEAKLKNVKARNTP
ncbi:MAG: DMT family transporter [Candidatus Midichloria sp.]|nr:DMT family transporter [Candidatus Midichloria sp.]